MTAPSTPQIPDELRPYLDTIADRLLSGHAAVMGHSPTASGGRPKVLGCGTKRDKTPCLLWFLGGAAAR